MKIINRMFLVSYNRVNHIILKVKDNQSNIWMIIGIPKSDLIDISNNIKLQLFNLTNNYSDTNITVDFNKMSDFQVNNQYTVDDIKQGFDKVKVSVWDDNILNNINIFYEKLSLDDLNE